jgi:hypothetical protein
MVRKRATEAERRAFRQEQCKAVRHLVTMANMCGFTTNVRLDDRGHWWINSEVKGEEFNIRAAHSKLEWAIFEWPEKTLEVFDITHRIRLLVTAEK